MTSHRAWGRVRQPDPIDWLEEEERLNAIVEDRVSHLDFDGAQKILSSEIENLSVRSMFSTTRSVDRHDIGQQVAPHLKSKLQQKILDVALSQGWSQQNPLSCILDLSSHEITMNQETRLLTLPTELLTMICNFLDFHNDDSANPPTEPYLVRVASRAAHSNLQVTYDNTNADYGVQDSKYIICYDKPKGVRRFYGTKEYTRVCKLLTFRLVENLYQCIHHLTLDGNSIWCSIPLVYTSGIRTINIDRGYLEDGTQLLRQLQQFPNLQKCTLATIPVRLRDYAGSHSIQPDISPGARTRAENIKWHEVEKLLTIRDRIVRLKLELPEVSVNIRIFLLPNSGAGLGLVANICAHETKRSGSIIDAFFKQMTTTEWRRLGRNITLSDEDPSTWKCSIV